jgi:hypothetical protein
MLPAAARAPIATRAVDHAVVDEAATPISDIEELDEFDLPELAPLYGGPGLGSPRRGPRRHGAAGALDPYAPQYQPQYQPHYEPRDERHDAAAARPERATPSHHARPAGRFPSADRPSQAPAHRPAHPAAAAPGSVTVPAAAAGHPAPAARYTRRQP